MQAAKVIGEDYLYIGRSWLEKTGIKFLGQLIFLRSLVEIIQSCNISLQSAVTT